MRIQAWSWVLFMCYSASTFLLSPLSSQPTQMDCVHVRTQLPWHGRSKAIIIGFILPSWWVRVILHAKSLYGMLTVQTGAVLEILKTTNPHILLLQNNVFIKSSLTVKQQEVKYRVEDENLPNTTLEQWTYSGTGNTLSVWSNALTSQIV